MSLRFIYGRSGSGKTDFCMKEAAALHERALIIVPEQYSFTAEKKLAQLRGVFGIGAAEVFSFGQLARRILKTCRGAALPHIDRGGKTMLLHKILHKNKRKLTLLQGNESDNAVQALKIITELKRYNVAPETLDALAAELPEGQLKMKTADIAIVYSCFEQELQGRFLNSEDGLLRMAAEIPASAFLKGAHIYLDSFTSFTPSELLCISTFLACADRVSVSLCMDRRGGAEFFACEKTEARLLSLARELSVNIESPIEMPPPGSKEPRLAHLEAEFFKYPHRPFTGSADNIELFTAKNPYSETAHTAARILALCREEGYLFRDIGVVCSNMDMYAKYIKTIFREYGISVFPDRKAAVSEHPVIIFLLSAIKIISDGYKYEDIFLYAKSGFTEIEPERIDLLENYILATNIRGSVWKSDEKWQVRASVYAEREELEDEEALALDALDETRRLLIAPVMRLEAALRTGKTVREKCAALYSFIKETNLPEQVQALADSFAHSGDTYKATEYKAVFNKIMDALDEMDAAMGEDTATPALFCEILQTGLSEYEIGLIPALQDGVLCGDIARIRGYDVRALFVIGMNDGMFPSPPHENGFLSDADRMALLENGIELAPDARTQGLENEHLVYKVLTLASERICLSYPSSDFDGKALRPALAFSRIKDIFPNAASSDDLLDVNDADALSCPEAAFDSLVEALASGGKLSASFQAAYEWFAASPEWAARLAGAKRNIEHRSKSVTLSDKTLAALGNSDITAVSRLERFSSCPFSYFMQYTLKARERKTAVLSTADAGTFLHNFIDEFSKRLSRGGLSWREADDRYIDKEIGEIMLLMDKRFNKHLLAQSKRLSRLFVRLCETVRFSLKIIREHICRGAFEPFGYEIKFEDGGDFRPLEITLQNGSRMKLVGRIDRADILERNEGGFVRIIDYKSGSKKFDLSDVFYGINLQLAVYITALCEGGRAKPAGILYFRLDDPLLRAEPGDSDEQIYKSKLKKLKLSGLLVDSEDAIAEMDNSEEERFSFLPVRLTKSGSYTGSVTDPVSFESLQNHVKKTVSRLTRAICDGKTDISPYQKANGDTPCTFCPYKSACRFDASAGGRYRKLPALGDSEVWDYAGKEGDIWQI